MFKVAVSPTLQHGRSLTIGFLAPLLLSSCAAPPPEETPAATNVTVIEGARVIIGDGSPPIENATLILEDDQFIHVGAGNKPEVPAGSVHVDLTGRTIMPAIIDTHVHLSPTRTALIEDLQRKAYYGVSAVLALGRGVSADSFQIRAETVPNAARYLTAGRGITAPEPGRTEVPYWITSEDEARSAVQELAEQDVDFVKIWVDDRNGQFDKLSPEIYSAVIDEAHKHELRVTAHIFALEDAKQLLRAGIDAFAHGVRDQDIDDEFVELVKERPHVVLVPNLGNRGIEEDLSWLSKTIPPTELLELQESYTDRPEVEERFNIQARNLARLNAEGMRIAFGTDGGAGWSPPLEMADMVASGMTPHEVIVAATQNSAELLELNDLGTIAVGNSADFIVLETNPLDDITNTRQIETVYLRGMAVSRDELSERWVGSAETP